MGFKTYGPHSVDSVAFVVTDRMMRRGRPRAYWPVRIIQIIGGKRWSLNVCIFTTPKPIPVSETGEGSK